MQREQSGGEEEASERNVIKPPKGSDRQLNLLGREVCQQLNIHLYFENESQLVTLDSGSGIKLKSRPGAENKLWCYWQRRFFSFDQMRKWFVKALQTFAL